MEFKLHPKARETSEKSIGISCENLQMKCLSTNNAELSISKRKMPIHEVKSRGSIFLALGRKVNMDKVNKIIRKF